MFSKKADTQIIALRVTKGICLIAMTFLIIATIFLFFTPISLDATSIVAPPQACRNTIPPQAYHDALRQRYPQATNITWRQVGNDYVATFQLNDYLTHSWINADGQWLMTDTDLQTTDQLPATVYNYFTLSNYADWNVTDVHRIAFKPAQNMKKTETNTSGATATPSFFKQAEDTDTLRYILLVNYDNSTETYQLYYSSDGLLLRIRNVSYLPVQITPDDIF